MRPHRGYVYLLFYLSGFTALIYQTLWLREIGLLIGNTSEASAATLGAFFSGLAAGNLFFAKKSTLIAKPLKAYGILECVIAVTAILYFVIYDIFLYIYPIIISHVGHNQSLILFSKIIISASIIFIPSFFMGGTLPFMGKFTVRTGSIGSEGPFLYGLNIIGAASGVLVAGFFLPQSIGIKGTYIFAIIY